MDPRRRRNQTFYNYPKKQSICELVTSIWKMLLVAEKRFRRLKAPELMKDVYQGAEYVNGVLVNQAPEEKAA